MAPHTWSFLGDTVSDATHQMYYRGQRIKEAYYRGEKIWGESVTQFRVRTVRVSGNILKVNFSGNVLEYSIDGGEREIVNPNENGLTNAIIINTTPYNTPEHIVTFYGIERLTHIDFASSLGLVEVLDPFPTMPLIESIHSCFKNCSKFSLFPNNLLWNNPQITIFDYAFYKTLVGEVTSYTGNKLSDLFSKSMNAISFVGTFDGVNFKKGIPFNLFAGLDKVTTFQECFANTKIGRDDFGTYVYASLFSDCANVTNFIETFAFSDLKTIPEYLFYYNRKVTRFIGCFAGCYNITSISSSLFQQCTEAVDFACCFERCTSLRSIPASLFQNNLKAEAFNECFLGCSSLTSIPSRLFVYNHNAYDFDFAFAYCSRIASIPTSLFPSLSNHMNDGKLTFANCFENCTSLTSIPDDLYSWFSSHVYTVTAQPLAISGIEQSTLNSSYLYYYEGRWRLNGDYTSGTPTLDDLHGEIVNFRHNLYGSGGDYFDNSYMSVVKPRYKDRITWNDERIIWRESEATQLSDYTKNYGQYSFVGWSEFVSGTFQYTFASCTNITGNVPDSFWNNVSFYGDNSSYINNGGWSCSDGHEAYRLLRVVLIAGACFRNDSSLTNYDVLPSMFKNEFTWSCEWEP